MEENKVPNVKTTTCRHLVTGNFLTYSPFSLIQKCAVVKDREHAVSGNTLDQSAIGAGP